MNLYIITTMSDWQPTPIFASEMNLNDSQLEDIIVELNKYHQYIFNSKKDIPHYFEMGKKVAMEYQIRDEAYDNLSDLVKRIFNKEMSIPSICGDNPRISRMEIGFLEPI